MSADAWRTRWLPTRTTASTSPPKRDAPGTCSPTAEPAKPTPRRAPLPLLGSVAAEWAMRLTPEPFRDFLPYTSLSALKVIHTGRVLTRALEIVQHYGSDAARTRAAQTLATSLSTAGLAIEIARSPVAPLNVTALSPEARAEIGASVLGLYFHQLHGRGPWFLDLRPRHFAWNDAQRSLSFFPSGLWYEPDPAFRLRVQALYEGFYRQAPAALATGVE